MQIVVGKRLAPMSGAELAELRRQATRIVMDVGTGDARVAYRIAKREPDWLVIGVDPAWQRMVETSVRSRRKSERGGASNLLLVNSAVEAVPPELAGLADEVYVLMPWGKLLRGLVRGEADVCGGLRRAAKPGASLDVTVGTNIWRDPIPREIRDLPELTLSYVDDILADRLLSHGWLVTARDLASGAHGERLSSSWARRLGSTMPETTMHIRAVAVV